MSDGIFDKLLPPRTIQKLMNLPEEENENSQELMIMP